MSRILYLGELQTSSTSFHRVSALKRLGHDVESFSPYEAAATQLRHPFWGKVHFRTGYRLLQPFIKNWLRGVLEKADRADLIWVNGGELFGPSALKLMNSTGSRVVLYNNDDPTGGRDGRRFDLMLQAIPYYDLCAVKTEDNIREYKERGAKKPVTMNMSYDEVFHRPFDDAAEIPELYHSDVVFIGTWMRQENRDGFLRELIRHGIRVSIWGNRWQKAPYWQELKEYYKGPALSGRDYVAAIQGSQIALGMLSKGNRDQSTRRSVEIPYAGGLLCAERTVVHQKMYQENEQAVFWDNAEECAVVCKRLLNDHEARRKIREAGRARVLELEVGNEIVCKKILESL